MKKTYLLLIFCMILVNPYLTVEADVSTLNGQHIVFGILTPFSVIMCSTRNATGHIIKAEGVGPEVLNVLSRRFTFTYSVLQVNDTRLDKENDALPGLAYYVAIGKCDLVIGPMVMTSKRLAILDFSEGFMYAPSVLLIPMPQPTVNMAAVVKPFQLAVWIGLLIAISILSVVIYFFIRPTNRLSSDDKVTKNSIYEIDPRSSLTIAEVFFEIFKILLSQGGYFKKNRNTVYFLAGSWCLGALVLVCAYNSLLTSYILGPNAYALVDSLNDLVEKPDVMLVVDRGFGVDMIISSATEGLYKQLGDKLRSNPKSRCETTQDCVDLVKSGSYTYLQGIFVMLNAIDEDYKSTGKCHLAIARKPDYSFSMMAWVLKKKSPYTNYFRKGFMELHGAGLIDLWTRWDMHKRRDVIKCLSESEQIQQKKISSNQTKITLKNFTGAFYVLIAGYIISFVTFMGERVCYLCKLRISKRNSRLSQMWMLLLVEQK